MFTYTEQRTESRLTHWFFRVERKAKKEYFTLFKNSGKWKDLLETKIKEELIWICMWHLTIWVCPTKIILALFCVAMASFLQGRALLELKERQQKLEQKVWSSHSSSSRVGSEKAFATCHQMVFAYKISYGCHNWICFFSETWLCPSLPEHHVCLCKRRCRGQFVTKTFTNQATPCNPLHVRWATMGRPT